MSIRDRALAAAARRRASAADAPTIPAPVGVRIEDTAGLICDVATGRYAHRTPSRDELERTLKFACRVWGSDTLWTQIDELWWTKLLRVRVEELVAKNCRAVRAAEISVSKLITAVQWLREVRHIPRDAAPYPKSWKLQILQHYMGITRSARAPEPHRPRYTLEESHKILAAATFDPRLQLLLWLGMELRLGQVARLMRTDLDLPSVDWAAPIDADDRTDYGLMRIHGAGHKGGGLVDLTRGQRRRLDDALAAGYLAPAEQRFLAGECKDYAVFVAGYVVGRVGFTRGQSLPLTMSDKVDWMVHVTSSWVRKNFREAEEKAGVPHIEGRGAYGLRRLGRDVADEEGLSPSGIESFGMWSAGSPIPAKVYRDRLNKVGRREARGARAALRGETNAA